MIRASRRQRERKLRKLKIVPCDFKLTSVGGLSTIIEIFDQTPYAEEFAKCLPERISHRSVGSYLLGLMVVAAHLHGMECLSDFSKLREDPALEALFGDEVAAARTIGDFLRDFDKEHIARLNRFLSWMSGAMFEQLKSVQPEPYKPTERIVDVDSMSHVQHGDKMIEGVAWNYKGEWCLDTQVAFNSLGFCHGLQLRAGNTKSGVAAPELINLAFRDHLTAAERRRGGMDYIRADSAYCNQDVIKCCLNLGVLFSITAHQGTMGWKDAIKVEPLSWQPWVYSEEERQKAIKTGQDLPLVEVARYHWSPSWAEDKLLFPVVVKRTWRVDKEKNKQGDLFYQDSLHCDGQWVYYAVVSNVDLNRWSIQEVFEHHAKRGHAENFNKEEKYNFKLRKFPCEKLMANHAWALLAQVAHNLLRWVALIESPERPHFSKKLRNRYIFSPGKIVRHARQVILKVMQPFFEEVEKLKQRHGGLPKIVPAHFAPAPSG